MKNLKMYLDKKQDKVLVDLIHQQIEKDIHNKWEDQMDQDLDLDRIQGWMECRVKVLFQMMEEKCHPQASLEVHHKDKILDKVHLLMDSDQAKAHKEMQVNLEDHNNKCRKELEIYLEEILLAENDLFFKFIRDLLINTYLSLK